MLQNNNYIEGHVSQSSTYLALSSISGHSSCILLMFLYSRMNYFITPLS